MRTQDFPYDKLPISITNNLYLDGVLYPVFEYFYKFKYAISLLRFWEMTLHFQPEDKKNHFPTLTFIQSKSIKNVTY